MDLTEKFTPIRKGLLEFLILKIVAANEVYVADILKRLSDTDFATQEGTLYPLLSKMRREGLVDYEWRESEAGPPRKSNRSWRKWDRSMRHPEKAALVGRRPARQKPGPDRRDRGAKPARPGACIKSARAR